ncbi:MAG: flagellar hook capping FlgD N-terminal domain-containing protein [Arcobacteraceae bacterium]|jgi:flagellar basal-body rod modification protein FlgD|nr:flagellar hook capping FlgD N-terminal domain-containing protein [Arcobacteraceae bacterium]MDX9795437.1 flagellar hook capping FlgD N-terminal domain-containing protein [Arcobacteraceae bacterium]
MSVDNVQVNTVVDANGNTYTSAVSNDKLTNSDFLKLMLEELKLQDPTKPMDSSQMMQNQMQMSTIETNTATIEAMKSLQNSFAQSTLASASNIIGQVIENGEIGDSGISKQFKVNSVESIDGTLYLEGYQIVGYNSETNQLIYDTEPTRINYNNITRVVDGSML